MISEKVEGVADLSVENFESDQVSVTVESTLSEEQDNKSRGGPHVKKLRSIKLSKSPSLKPSTRRSKSQFRNIAVELFSDVENSPCSTLSRFSSFSQVSPYSLYYSFNSTIC